MLNVRQEWLRQIEVANARLYRITHEAIDEASSVGLKSEPISPRNAKKRRKVHETPLENHLLALLDRPSFSAAWTPVNVNIVMLSNTVEQDCFVAERNVSVLSVFKDSKNQEEQATWDQLSHVKGNLLLFDQATEMEKFSSSADDRYKMALAVGRNHQSTRRGGGGIASMTLEIKKRAKQMAKDPKSINKMSVKQLLELVRNMVAGKLYRFDHGFSSMFANFDVPFPTNSGKPGFDLFL